MTNNTRSMRVDINLEKEFRRIKELYKQKEGVDISLSKASYIFWRNYKRGFDGFGGIG